MTAAGINHPDLYQMLAYAVAADLPGGLLVYAAGEGEYADHRVTHLGKTLEVVLLNLSGKPSEILTEIKEIAVRVRRLRADAIEPRVAA